MTHHIIRIVILVILFSFLISKFLTLHLCHNVTFNSNVEYGYQPQKCPLVGGWEDFVYFDLSFHLIEYDF